MASRRDQDATVLEGGADRSGRPAEKNPTRRSLTLPYSRAMASIGKRCHELRVTDKEHEWRIVYRVDVDAIVIGDVFEKKTQKAPRNVMERCRKRLEAYDRAVREGKKR